MASEALLEFFKKIDPRPLARNPVKFVVEIGFFFTFVEAVYNWLTGESVAKFETYIAMLLLFIVLFSTFEEAIAEGRGKAQAESLRRAKKGACQKITDNVITEVNSAELVKGYGSRANG